MINLQKYRRFILVTFMVIVLAAFLTLAAIWNSLLTVKDIRNEGWIIVFMMILIAACVVMFLFAIRLSDQDAFQENLDQIIAAEKEKLTKRMEEKKSQAQESLYEETDISERITQVLSGLNAAKSIDTFGSKLLMNLSKEIEIVRGVFFFREEKGDVYICKGEYAITGKKPEPFKLGENLSGQVAKNKTLMSLHEIPENYFKAESGLGGALPRHLFLFPLLYKNETIAVVEVATFKKIDSSQLKILNTLTSELGERMNKFVSV
jgi:hypothetical protein